MLLSLVCSVVAFSVMEERCGVNASVMDTGGAGEWTCERRDASGGNMANVNESDKECDNEESTSAALDGNICGVRCGSATAFPSTGRPGSIDTVG